jgi:hypothetical protein
MIEPKKEISKKYIKKRKLKLNKINNILKRELVNSLSFFENTNVILKQQSKIQKEGDESCLKESIFKNLANEFSPSLTENTTFFFESTSLTPFQYLFTSSLDNEEHDNYLLRNFSIE